MDSLLVDCWRCLSFRAALEWWIRELAWKRQIWRMKPESGNKKKQRTQLPPGYFSSRLSDSGRGIWSQRVGGSSGRILPPQSPAESRRSLGVFEFWGKYGFERFLKRSGLVFFHHWQPFFRLVDFWINYPWLVLISVARARLRDLLPSTTPAWWMWEPQKLGCWRNGATSFLFKCHNFRFKSLPKRIYFFFKSLLKAFLKKLNIFGFSGRPVTFYGSACRRGWTTRHQRAGFCSPKSWWKTRHSEKTVCMTAVVSFFKFCLEGLDRGLCAKPARFSFSPASWAQVALWDVLGWCPRTRWASCELCFTWPLRWYDMQRICTCFKK